jgi:hypothetical protein
MINCGICGNAFDSPDKCQYICEPCLVPPEYRAIPEPAEVPSNLEEQPCPCCRTGYGKHNPRCSALENNSASVLGRPTQAEDARQKDMRRLEEIGREAGEIAKRLGIPQGLAMIARMPKS